MRVRKTSLHFAHCVRSGCYRVATRQAQFAIGVDFVRMNGCGQGAIRHSSAPSGVVVHGVACWLYFLPWAYYRAVILRASAVSFKCPSREALIAVECCHPSAQRVPRRADLCCDRRRSDGA